MPLCPLFVAASSEMPFLITYLLSCLARRDVHCSVCAAAMPSGAVRPGLTLESGSIPTTFERRSQHDGMWHVSAQQADV